jgi:hypothetical protein
MAKEKTTETKAKKPAAKKSAPPRPTLEKLQAEIKAKAHQVYLERTSKGEPGDELSDWIRAEAAVKKTYGL